MGEGLLDRLANEVLEASEQIVTRFEEGISVLTTGELPQQTASDGAAGHEMPNLDDMDIDDLSEEEVQILLEEQLMDNSPLEGIASSVIGDIVSKQVSVVSSTL